jgi:23S rRNA (cytosine1962-C5)-methyltransferase
VLRGTLDGPIAIRIGDASFTVDPMDPHKTGFYLDQQANYRLIARQVRPGARVLDAFCHLGGFAIHACLAGAASAIAIDSAEASIAGARAAASANGVGERIDFRCANAFDVLKAADEARERFDLIILDPPTFTRTRDAVPGALRGYKEIHLRALYLLKEGGRLATFTCSHHVGRDLFLGTVLDAAADARVTIRLEQTLAASPDHPVLPAVPESEYLKGFVFSKLTG